MYSESTWFTILYYDLKTTIRTLISLYVGIQYKKYTPIRFHFQISANSSLKIVFSSLIFTFFDVALRVYSTYTCTCNVYVLDHEKVNSLHCYWTTSLTTCIKHRFKSDQLIKTHTLKVDWIM